MSFLKRISKLIRSHSATTHPTRRKLIRLHSATTHPTHSGPKLSTELKTILAKAQSRILEKGLGISFAKMQIELKSGNTWIPKEKRHGAWLYFTLRTGGVEVTEKMKKELDVENIASSLDKTLENYDLKP